MTRHRSCRNSSGACASPFPFLFVCLFFIGCYPRFSFVCFLRFQSPRSLRIDCASVFVRVVSPVERVSGKTPKNLRLHRWLALFCPRLSPLPFLLLPNPRLPPDPLSLFLFLLARASARAFPFPFSPGCECHLTHWSPEPGQRVVPPFCGGSIPLQWSPDLEGPVRLDKLPLVLPFSEVPRVLHSLSRLVVQETSVSLSKKL